MQRPAAPERSGSNRQQLTRKGQPRERFELLAVSDLQSPQIASRSEQAATHDDAARSQTPHRPGPSAKAGVLHLAQAPSDNHASRGQRTGAGSPQRCVDMGKVSSAFR